MENIDTEIKKVWMITGTSSGFGRRTAEEALERGHYVIATCRDPKDIEDLNEKYSDRVITLPLDVTDPESIKNAVEKGVERHHRIDILMNNAGYGVGGAIEETSDEEARKQFDVNVFGLLNVTQEVLPHMRERNEGLIINLSSMLGLTSIGGMGIYGSTKFAVEGISEALADEVKNLGLKLMLVEPGAFDTGFAESMMMVDKQIEDYKPIRETLEGGIEFNGDPDRAATAIVAAATCDTPPARLILGEDAIAGVNEKLHYLHENIDEWEQVSRAMAKGDDKDVRPLVPADRS
ncbi:MAG: oxidoreductase [Verrucomicrobiales bacterium]|nr:oxidoreductase [Verrucomicrobiales bacterium]